MSHLLFKMIEMNRSALDLQLDSMAKLCDRPLSGTFASFFAAVDRKWYDIGKGRHVMLIEFRVENHRSLRDEQVFSMAAGRVGDDDDQRPRRVAGYPEKLLPVGVLYGANASGKSNVLAALQFMRDAVIESQRGWPPDTGVPRRPVCLGIEKGRAFVL